MIKIENLSFSYSKKSKLYNELDLQVESGSIIGLLGKNGAGKSTLLKLMAGLLKPQKGSLSIMDYTPFDRKPGYLQDIFFVAEDFSVPSVSVKSYINAMSPLYPKFDKDKMDRLIVEMELEGKGNLGKMSYGQKKKFIIAFALATNCKLLLMDEPTNGLDIPSKALFRKILAGALSDKQIALISTHQVKDVENLIDRIVLIENGKFIFNESTLDISDKYGFYTVSHLNGDDYLYKEMAPGGYRVIKGGYQQDTPIDIELLFNAIVNGTKLEIHEPSI